MPNRDKQKYRWFHSTTTTWTSETVTRDTNYTGVITYNPLAAYGQAYSLSINSGAYTSAWQSLKLAKDDFRKFLHTK